ncbi:MAG: SAM-dependent methyltransferase [Clostridiales bacterium]|nr:SAM-dependent methyltransferase [Clostridiales bacterium]
MSLKLTPRLEAVASLVNSGGTLADIGTDHAYLPAFLVLEGRVKSAVACDIRKMPLENAAETLRRFGLSEKITLRLSDGLDAVGGHEADEIVIAGMGGTLMAEILSRAQWLKSSSKHLVLQPQTHSEDVRRFLCENGFEILCERAAAEGRHVYGVISGRYRGTENTKSNAYYYVA